MDGFGDLTRADLPLFLLALMRVSGMVFLAPVFGSPSHPPQVRALLSLLLALLFFPSIRGAGLAAPPDLWTLLLAAGGELAVGMAIGFASALLFAGVQFAGQIVDQELGIQQANLLDPFSGETISVVGQFKVFLATLVFLLIDGHHFLLQAVGDSFRTVPPLGFAPSAAAATALSDTMIADLFRMAVQIAAPTLVTLFLVTVALAFMARTVPELNIFILGFALRAGVGLGVVALGVGIFVSEFADRALRHAQTVTSVVRMLGP
jgi:flagellar biosynthesis protein FliR